MSSSFRFLACTAALLIAGTSAAQNNWIDRTTPSGPSHRVTPGMTYDPARGNMVMFGGLQTSPVIAYQNDTWTWDGSAWTQRTPANSPPGRSDFAMGFDAARSRAVIFGGFLNGNSLNDTWEWDGATWAQVVTATQPSPRRDARLTCDPVRGVMVMFGGLAATAVNETWEYNGVNWTQVTTAGSPPARMLHGQAFDVARNRTVIFGGLDSLFGPARGDTWTYDGATWTQVLPATSPSARGWLEMTYDLARGVTVLFGGTDLGFFPFNFDDTWEWNGTNWSMATPATVPPSRDSHAIAYDQGRAKVVIFGGYDASFSGRNDTWEYGSANAATWFPFGSGCAGSAGVPVLAASGTSVPRLNTTLQLTVGNLPPPGVIYMVFGWSNTVWNSLALPSSLQSFGMPGCTAFVSVEAGSLIAGSSGTASWSLFVPNSPALIGTRFFNQAVSIDPAAGNAGGAVVSNAGQGRVGN